MVASGAPSTAGQVREVAQRMLDDGCHPEYTVAYLAQRDVPMALARSSVERIVDERAARHRTRVLRRRAITHHALGLLLTLLGVAAAWSARVPGSGSVGPLGLAGVAVVGYVLAWRGLLRWLGAGRAALAEVRRERSMLGRVGA